MAIIKRYGALQMLRGIFPENKDKHSTIVKIFWKFNIDTNQFCFRIRSLFSHLASYPNNVLYSYVLPDLDYNSVSCIALAVMWI